MCVCVCVCTLKKIVARGRNKIIINNTSRSARQNQDRLREREDRFSSPRGSLQTVEARLIGMAVCEVFGCLYKNKVGELHLFDKADTRFSGTLIYLSNLCVRLSV